MYVKFFKLIIAGQTAVRCGASLASHASTVYLYWAFPLHIAGKVEVSDTTMLSIVEKVGSNNCFLHYQRLLPVSLLHQNY
jgi:hypothetical protein